MATSVIDESMETWKKHVLDKLKQIQVAGGDAYNLEVTGCGVSVWKLSDAFPGCPPAFISGTLKVLSSEKRVQVIDPDSNGMPSFLAI